MVSFIQPTLPMYFKNSWMWYWLYDDKQIRSRCLKKEIWYSQRKNQAWPWFLLPSKAVTQIWVLDLPSSTFKKSFDYAAWSFCSRKRENRTLSRFFYTMQSLKATSYKMQCCFVIKSIIFLDWFIIFLVIHIWKYGFKMHAGHSSLT